MNDQQNTSQAPQGEANPGQSTPIDSGRRRFTAAGLATSGLLMTMAARPALGATGCAAMPNGTTLSGWISGNQSLAHEASISLGKSPGYWKMHPWPGGAPSPSTLYKTFFPGSMTSTLGSKVICKDSTTPRYLSLLDVLSAEIYDNEFGRSIVCAYLNAVAGTPPRPTTAEVKLMSTLGFKPTPTAPAWTAYDVVCFLSQTFDSKSL